MVSRLLLASIIFTGCKACVSLDRPLDFPCNPDASQPALECNTGSRCGLEGQCHPLDAGASYACRDSADCEGPWRCGLEGVCHALDAGAAYQCVTDDQCEAAWRCGPAAHCVDATADALELPDAGFTDLTVRPLFAQMPRGAGAIGASRSETHNVVNDAGCAITLSIRSQSWVTGNVLVRHISYPDGWALPPGGVAPSSQACEDAQHTSTFGPRGQDQTTLVPNVIALAETPLATVTLASDGTVCRFGVDPADLYSPLPLKCATPFQGGLPTHLKRVESDDRLLAWNDSQLWWLEAYDAPAIGPFSVRALDGGVASVRDALGFALPSSVNGMGVAVASDDALYTALIDGGMLYDRDGTPKSFSPNLMDAVAQFPGKARALAGGDFNNSSALWFALGELVFVYQGSGGVATDTSYPLDFGGSADGQLVGYIDRKHSCEKTDDYTDLSLNPVHIGGAIGELTRCSKVPNSSARPANGAPVALGQVDTTSLQVGGEINDVDDDAVLPVATFFHTDARAGTGNPLTTAWADSAGHLWYGTDDRDDTSLGVVPLFPDSVLTNVGGDSTTLRVATSGFDWFADKSDGIGKSVVTFNAWAIREDGGFEEEFKAAGVGSYGAVRGLPASDIVTFPSGILPTNVFVADEHFARILAATNDTTATLPPVDLSVYANASGRYLLWRSFDAIWVVEMPVAAVSFSIDGLTQAPAPLRRLTPVPNSPITSLADREVTDGGFFEGYVIAGQRLFNVTAPNPRVWRDEEVVVGADQPLEVFYDRGRARVALSDGSMWALPSRVQVAPSFDASVGQALGFGFACQNVLALTPTGLYRLKFAAGQGQGQWEQVTLPADVSAASLTPGLPFQDGTLKSIDRDVLLTLGDGMTFRLGFGGCQ